MVEWLAEATLPHGGQQWLAGAVGVSRRTVQEWMNQVAPSERPPGRPAHASHLRWRALRAVARAARELGESAGWRVLGEVLGLPRGLSVEALARWKLRWRRKERERREVNRVSMRVERRDVVWSQDATHLGRIGGREVKAQVVKEAASGRTLLARVAEGASTGRDVKG